MRPGSRVLQFDIRTLRIAVWASFIVAFLGIGSAVLLTKMSEPSLPTVRYSGEASIRSIFSLIDHSGRFVTEANYQDRWQLVFFGYTHCPDICPTTLAYMGSVLNLLGENAAQIVPLFVTVDPKRDTVEVMANYVSAFHPKIIGLTGNQQQIAAAAKEFKVYYEKREDSDAPDGYLMAHSGYFYLMRPGGKFEAIFREGNQSPKQLAEEILMQIEKAKKLQ